MAYHRTHGVDTRIVRIFNTYGPRMQLDDGRVVPNFVGQALRGEPLTVYGDGQPDPQLLLRGRSGRRHGPAADRRTSTLPSTSAIRTRSPSCEFAEVINRLTDNPAGVILAARQPHGGRPASGGRPDISKARRVLGLGAGNHPGRRPAPHN